MTTLTTLKEMNFEQLNMELINRGIVYDSPDIPDEYEQCASLEGIYPWGFTVITYCNVLDPIIAFYDWECQAILSLNHDSDTKYHLNNGRLFVEEYKCFSNETHKYGVNLNNGAPVHVKDIAAIGYMPSKNYHDKRFYALNDGRIYVKEDGKALELLPKESNANIASLINEGYVLVGKDAYDNLMIIMLISLII